MAGNDIGVRKLEADEVDLLRHLRLTALAESPAMFSQPLADAAGRSDEYWRASAARLAEGTSSICLVAHRGIESVGMVFGVLDEEHGDVARVYGMWVAPPARRAGAGAKLLGAVRSWATLRRRLELRLHVFHDGPHAHAFYRSQGLRPIAAAPDADGFVEYGAALR